MNRRTEWPGPGTHERIADFACRDATRSVVLSVYDHPRYQGGGQAVIKLIAGRLAEYFNVTVITTGKRRETVICDGVRYQTLPVGWAGPRGGQLAFHAALPFAVRKVPHDLWIESFTPPFSTSFLPLFSRSRVVGLAQSLSGEEMWARYRLPFFLLERLGLRFYQDVIALNHSDGLRIHAHCPSGKVHVIPNGIETIRVDKRRFGAGEHVLFLGRIDIMEKGLDLLLAAYRTARLSIPLVVAGSGAPREEKKLTRLMAGCGADVRWVGRVTGPDKRHLLERSAFAALPSRQETFGLAALEAMSYGKPVIHFDLPALRWMSGDVRVLPFDTSALAEAMRRLSTDAEMRRSLGGQAYQAAQEYGVEATIGRYLSLVGDLTGVSGSAESSAGSSRTCR